MCRLTVIVLTLNEAPRLAHCLASVRGVADELIVVDSGSTDGTQRIAAQFGARLFERPWPGRAEQTRFAIDQATAPWILLIDADEVSSPELNGAVNVALAGAPDDLDGYTVDRTEWFLGRPIRCGFHRGLPRLCRTDRVLTPSRRAHASLAVPGALGRLGPLLQHRVDQPLDEVFVKWMRRARLSALDYQADGRRFSALALIWHPLATLLRLYVLKGGFRDGVPGLVFCGLRAAYCFARLAHLYDLERHERGPR